MLRNLPSRLVCSSYRGMGERVTRCSCQILVPTRSKSSADESIKEEDPPSLPPPPFPIHDWIGPADRKSNLRRVILAQPLNETDAERHYRVLRNSTNEWNHQFWSRQNEIFIKAKEDFVQTRLIERQRDREVSSDNADIVSGIKQVLSAEEMAEFYQQFLKDNQHSFQEYNKQWYLKNFSLLWPAFKANVSKLMKMDKR